jgi:hypothetical protein
VPAAARNSNISNNIQRESIGVGVGCAAAATDVLTVLVQLPPPGHDGSPPPDTVAVFETVVPLAAAVGVTGITKLTDALGARAAATVHVTVCPLAVQLLGKVPIVRLAGTMSVTVAAVVVDPLPVLVTLSV